MTDPLADDGYDHTADHRLELLDEITADPRYPDPNVYGDYVPPRGRCSCGLWSMVGPHDVVTDFHNFHLKETAPS